MAVDLLELRPEAIEAAATPPFAWRASAGGFEIVSRSGGGAAVRFEARLDATGLAALRGALGRGGGGEPEPGRNDLCSCGSGRKYKRCCGV